MNARFLGANLPDVNLLVFDLPVDPLAFGAVALLVVRGFRILLLMTTSTPRYGHLAITSCVTSHCNAMAEIQARIVLND